MYGSLSWTARGAAGLSAGLPTGIFHKLYRYSKPHHYYFEW